MLSTLNLTVTNLSDPSGPTGTVSLRQAINMANADTIDSQEIISFASGISGTINLTEALANLSNNISITGPGASSLMVNRVSTAADFSIFTINSGETVNISGITIEGGDFTSITSSGGGGGGGGGISNNGTLAISNDVFTNNIGMDGGGIYNTNILTVTNSTFTSNSSGSGGGICNSGTSTVTNSTFTQNTGGGDGGGLYNSGTITILDSIIANNSNVDGAGFENYDGTATVINSTIANNNSVGSGGAIENRPGDHTLTITNSTIVGNNSSSTIDDVGGINNFGALVLNNTIVANNTGYNISGPANTGSNNLIGVNPDLGPLQNNGGPTETMALLPGSPAIGTGSVALAVNQNGTPLTTDQRGAGYPRTVNGTVDIGAYEHSPVQTITFGPLANQTYGVAPIALNTF